MSATRSPSWSPTRSEQARDAAEAIEIEWEPLPHVIGAVAALEKRRRAGLAETGRAISPSRSRSASRPRPPSAFAQAARTVSLTLVNQRLVTNYLDTRGVDRRIRRGARPPHADARQPGQPLPPRHACRDVLKHPARKDARGHAGRRRRLRHQAVHLSRIRAGGGRGADGSSVRCAWIADRTEHFLGDAQGRDNITTAKLALDDEGRFLALDIDIVADMGAYLSAYAPYIPVSRRRHVAGRLRHSGTAHVQRARRLHQHRAGRCLSRRRPAGGGLRDRAAGRCRRARTGRRARRAAPEEFHQAESDALHDRDRQDLRHRRVRRPHGARAGARRLGRLQEARRGGQAARAAARHRPCDLYRSLRQHGRRTPRRSRSTRTAASPR